MTRERRNLPVSDHSGRRRERAVEPARARRRASDQPEIELSEEEVMALADEGLDPDEILRVARERSEAQEASEHDRDTARDQLEGLVLEQEEDY